MPERKRPAPYLIRLLTRGGLSMYMIGYPMLYSLMEEVIASGSMAGDSEGRADSRLLAMPQALRRPD